MKKFYSICRRSLALFTAAVMCAGMLQISALADGMEDAADEREIEVHTVTVDVDDSRSAEPASTENSEDDSKNNETPASNEDDDKSKDANETEGTEAQNSDDETPAGTKDGVDQEDPKDQEGPKDPEDTASEEQSEETEESKEAEPFPADGTEEEQKQWYQENVERPGQTDVTTTPVPTELPNKAPSDEEQPGEAQPGEDQTPAAPVVPDGWEVFYNEEKDCYELTFEIDEDAEGDQTIDLTKALELLGQYAQANRDQLEQAKADLEAQKAQKRAELEELEDYQAYKAQYAEYQKAHAEDMVAVKQILKNFGSGYDITGKTDDELVAEFDRQFGTMFGELAKEPEIPESIREQLEAINNMTMPEGVGFGSAADVLEPGDIRRFEIYLTSKSGHTYKYKNGSFTLATPEWTGDTGSGVIAFDGQELPEEYVDRAEYHVTLRSEPIQSLLKELGMDDYDAFNGYPSYWNYDIKERLSKYGKDTLAENLNAYLLDYYNSKDGTAYTTIDELVKSNPDAMTELTKTETSGNKWFKIDGETFVVDAHLATVRYDKFYQSLISFVYGDEDTLTGVMGERNEKPNADGTYGYENDSWTYEGKKQALAYYMSHQEIWKTTDEYFQKLLEKGLSEEVATWTSFMMAINIDGELTGNDWQDTKWPWYNSIQLEQRDFDFNLEKVDENGKLITSDKTGFQIWRMDVVKDENGNEVNKKVYCTQIPQVDDATGEITGYTYVFDATATAENAILYTENGKLDIANTLMKDIVYYLQEVAAPDGYDLDTTVYVIMDEDAAKDANWEELEKEAGITLEYGEDGLPTSLIKVTTDENGVPRTETIQIVNTKKPEEPPKDPENPKDPKDPEDPKDPDDPKDPRTPETPETPTIPTTEIPEEDIPLTEIPEEDIPLEEIPEEDIPKTEIPEEDIPLTEIPEEDIPLSEVPKTGDASQLWTMLTLFSGLGLVWLCLAGRKRERA